MKKVLEVSNLAKRFGGITAVNDVSFDVYEGEILGIIGPNGCGKSTLFNCILGQLQPTSGTVKLDGRETTGKRDAGLGAAADRMIQFFKLGHLATEKAGGLSYGQQKLLDAAMAFMAGPRLVLLDEPAGGVNLTMLGDLKERLQAINREQGATFVVIEHNMDFVMSLCSRVVVLAEGQVLAMGTPAEVRANPAVIAAYLGH